MNYLEGTTTLQITKAELRALLAHASDDTTRPQLAGVGIFPDTGRIIATDGHRLVAWTPENPVALPAPAPRKGFVIPRETLEQLAKAAKPKDTILIDLGAEGAIGRVIGGVTLAMAYAADSGELTSAPPVDQVIPRYSEGDAQAVTTFAARYIADLRLVALAAGGVSEAMAIQHGPGLLDPCLVRFQSGPDERGSWLAVVMPVRADGPALGTYEASAVAAPAQVARPLIHPDAQDVDPELRATVAELASLDPSQLAAARKAIARIRTGAPASVVELRPAAGSANAGTPRRARRAPAQFQPEGWQPFRSAKGH